jgi:hypothetical protein
LTYNSQSVPDGRPATFQLFPNPVKGNTRLVFEGLPDPSSEIIIATVLGETVLVQKALEKTTMLNLENRDRGIYFITVRNGSNYFTKKIILE